MAAPGAAATAIVNVALEQQCLADRWAVVAELGRQLCEYALAGQGVADHLPGVGTLGRAELRVVAAVDV